MISTQEVAKLLGVAPATVLNYRKVGKLPGEKIKNKYFFKPEIVSAFLQATKESKEAKPVIHTSSAKDKQAESSSESHSAKAETPQKAKRSFNRKNHKKPKVDPASKGFARLAEFQRRAIVETKDFGTAEFWNENAQIISKSLPKSALGGVKQKIPHIPKSYAQPLPEPTELNLEEVLQNLQVKKAMDYVKGGHKANQLRLRPKAYIRRIWKKWFEMSNKVYNLCIGKIMGHRWRMKRDLEKEGKKLKRKCEFSQKMLRNLVRKKLGTKIKACHMPYAAWDHAVEQAIRASEQKGAMRVKKRESPTTIQVRGEYIKHGHLFFKNTKDELYRELLKTDPKAKLSHADRLLKSEPNPALKQEALQKYANLNGGKIPYCYLTPKYGLKKYFLCISYPVTPATEAKGVVALDPGIRTFLTYYDGKTAGDLGKEVHKNLRGLNRYEYTMKERLKTLSWKKRSNVRRALNRLKERRQNIVEELHKKAANFLCNYRYILLPRYSINWMLPRNRRSGGQLNFFKFKLRIITKASQRGSTVILCNEAHTSKTCSVCGTRQEIGSSKVYECKSCSYKADRDYNAAQNILIRSLRDSQTPIPQRAKKEVSATKSK